MEDVRDLQERYPGAPTCCPFHGYIISGRCYGTDSKENEVKVNKMKVCHNHQEVEDAMHHEATKTLQVETRIFSSIVHGLLYLYMQVIETCPYHCNYKSEFLDDVSNRSVT